VKNRNKGFTPLEVKISNWESNRGNKRFLTGFTVVELLTAVAIMAILIGVLLPALTYVRNTAKATMQKAQFATIELALTTFRNDYGDYPPSDTYSHDISEADYCGAQKLAEALLGRDLLGFHPKSTWSATDTTWYPDSPNDYNLSQRKGPYLEQASVDAFRLGELFDDPGDTNADRYVLCDVFGAKKITIVTRIGVTVAKTTTFNAGTPILYFKANTSSKGINPGYGPPYIYVSSDNFGLVDLGRVKDGKPHEDFTAYPDPTAPSDDFIFYIMDPKASTGDRLWPYRPDSYILISAGVDGFYGTPDDITNF